MDFYRVSTTSYLLYLSCSSALLLAFLAMGVETVGILLFQYSMSWYVSLTVKIKTIASLIIIFGLILLSTAIFGLYGMTKKKSNVIIGYSLILVTVLTTELIMILDGVINNYSITATIKQYANETFHHYMDNEKETRRIENELRCCGLQVWIDNSSQAFSEFCCKEKICYKRSCNQAIMLFVNLVRGLSMGLLTVQIFAITNSLLLGKRLKADEQGQIIKVNDVLRY